MFLVPKYHLLHRYKNALFFFSFFSLFFFLLLFSHAKATATKVKLKRATISLPYYTRTKPIDSMGQPKIKRYNIQAQLVDQRISLLFYFIFFFFLRWRLSFRFFVPFIRIFLFFSDIPFDASISPLPLSSSFN